MIWSRIYAALKRIQLSRVSQLKANRAPLVVYVSLLTACLSASIYLHHTRYVSRALDAKQFRLASELVSFDRNVAKLKNLKHKITTAKTQGVDTASLAGELIAIEQNLFTIGNYVQTKTLIIQTEKSLNTLITLSQQAKQAEADKQLQAAVQVKASGTSSNKQNPSATAPTVGSTSADCSTSSPVAELLCRINTYRKDNGKGALALDSSLSAAAAGQSQWMNSSNVFSHTGQNDSQFYERCGLAGTSCSAENIAYGPNVTTIFSDWKNSPGHNANMLGNYSAIGIGISGIYYTADFR